MIVYAESSAVLSWLLGEPRGPEVRRILEAAEFVVTSDLTLVECDRALHRARSLTQISELVFEELSNELQRIASGWILLRLVDEIVARAGNTARQRDGANHCFLVWRAAILSSTGVLELHKSLAICTTAGVANKTTAIAAAIKSKRINVLLRMRFRR